MHLRRTLALATGALLISPVLSSCAEATDRIYTPAAGVQNRAEDVDVLNAVIVSAEHGSGTFVASFVNNSTDEDATVEGLEGTDTANPVTADTPNVQIPPRGLVNLATEGGIEVTGEFGAGETVPVAISFGDGSTVEMRVPVVTNCDIWEGLDGDDTAACEAASDDAHSE
jgi:hypothetical protein